MGRRLTTIQTADAKAIQEKGTQRGEGSRQYREQVQRLASQQTGTRWERGLGTMQKVDPEVLREKETRRGGGMARDADAEVRYRCE